MIIEDNNDNNRRRKNAKTKKEDVKKIYVGTREVIQLGLGNFVSAGGGGRRENSGSC